MFKDLLFRWSIHRKGVRFYETSLIPKSQEFKSATFGTVGDESVEFFFYKEECEDLIHRKGKISREHFVGYVIQARFGEGFPEDLKRFNNMKFFFNSKDFDQNDEEMITRALLRVYLDFLRCEMKK